MNPLIQIFCYPAADWLETLDTQATYLFLNQGIYWVLDTPHNQKALAPLLRSKTLLYVLKEDKNQLSASLLTGVQTLSLEEWVALTVTHNPVVSH